ncbi:hypothetical protein SAMN02787118_127104 [Streptomyces mirabilis]|jgi:hypothetical protein|uniref:Uncharacterized protein n=1 Tax=Streptomyces mirabilis TaxID=68239 RepID=A0A1I2UJ68_9ACTN|nr:hypothetical protein SAMN02787118_127104 [Streptomyces mirabilis]
MRTDGPTARSGAALEANTFFGAEGWRLPVAKGCSRPSARCAACLRCGRRPCTRWQGPRSVYGWAAPCSSTAAALAAGRRVGHHRPAGLRSGRRHPCAGRHRRWSPRPALGGVHTACAPAGTRLPRQWWPRLRRCRRSRAAPPSPRSTRRNDRPAVARGPTQRRCRARPAPPTPTASPRLASPFQQWTQRLPRGHQLTRQYGIPHLLIAGITHTAHGDRPALRWFTRRLKLSRHRVGGRALMPGSPVQ